MRRTTLLPLLIVAMAAVARAQTIDPFYSGSYSFVDLGSVPQLPANYGGLTLLAGDNNTLLIGGQANSASGAIYSIGVTRDAQNHITGFTGTAQVFASAPYNDGGITYGPGGVLFASRWPTNELAQYKPGSTTPDKIIDLAALGVAASHSAITFAPNGDAKLSSWSGGQFYTSTLTPDGTGTFDLGGVTQVETLGGGPEGFAYIPVGSPLFTTNSMIVSEYTAGVVSTYEVDANYNPIASTRRTFMDGLTGAEGAFIDPLTGDFLFSTFGGGNRVIRVSGFVPEPGTMAVLGLGALGLLRRRRKSV